jgi:hypothetical protein
VPLDVSTLPFVPGATNNGADVPLPRMTLLAVKVDAPVPPLATAKVPVVMLEALTVCAAEIPVELTPDIDPVPSIVIAISKILC